MTAVITFLKMDNETKWLLIKALLFLWVVRIMLWLFSFNRVQKVLKKWKTNKSPGNTHLSRITWSINVMSRFTPRDTCLVRALAGWLLLAQYGFDSQVKIGVFKDDEFEAHAWLEHDQQVVLGDCETDYVPIISWNDDS